MVNAFIGKTGAPTDSDLAAELGRSAHRVWDQLLTSLAEQQGVAVREWNSYSPKAGWALRLKKGKRVIMYLSPCRGSFVASFALGQHAVEAARQSGLPRSAIDVINTARCYAEGTAVRIEVQGPADLAVVQKLAAAKVAH